MPRDIWAEVENQSAAADSVRYIPRSCSCTWTLHLGVVPKWKLTETAPDCRLHGGDAR